MNHVADHPQRVGVNGIDMEQVVLHLPDDAAEFREVSAEHVVALHVGQGGVQFMGGPQQLHEQGDAGQVLPEGIVDQVAVGPDGADGRRPDALHFRMLGEDNKDLQQRVGGVGENLGVGGLQVTVADLEPPVHGHDLLRLLRPQDFLIKVLQDDVGQLRQCQDAAVVGLHHQFDAQPAVLFLKVEHAGQIRLVVEQKPVFVALGKDLKAVAQLPEECFPLPEDAEFFIREDGKTHQV